MPEIFSIASGEKCKERSAEVLHRSISSTLKRKKILVGIQSLRKVRNYYKSSAQVLSNLLVFTEAGRRSEK